MDLMMALHTKRSVNAYDEYLIKQRRNFYKTKQGIERKSIFSSSFRLSSSKEPCIHSGDGEPGNIPESAAPEGLGYGYEVS